jgi:hypothetical protein
MGERGSGTIRLDAFPAAIQFDQATEEGAARSTCGGVGLVGFHGGGGRRRAVDRSRGAGWVALRFLAGASEDEGNWGMGRGAGFLTVQYCTVQLVRTERKVGLGTRAGVPHRPTAVAASQ